MDSLLRLPIWVQALLATLFTYLLTALGAALVLLLRKPRKLLMDGMMAVGAGIMLASAFWSLLEPGISLANDLRQVSWLIAAAGFLCGAFALILGDWIYLRRIRTLHPEDSRRRTCMLIVSITLHNIPEGLAVGVAFGALAADGSAVLLTAAWMLALGIGIQNFPEGAAVSMPLLREGFSPRRSFFYGQLSGLVEPVAGLLGALLAASMRQALPFLMVFAAGAMIYVVLSELIPENQTSEHPAWMTLATMLGFTLMMALDVAFG